ncbi:hypothetical protein [Acinetobacter towneri]|uniref:hypothetical protein n=1 Tax=Acinetobacter towneri TaxID=202956 RepID=UPI003989F580
MTNRLELNWKLDGFVNEQRYYCSETPIDPLNLPVPKAVLAGDVRTYIDSVGIEKGKQYYLAVGSVKNGIEKLSDQVKLLAGVAWTPANLTNPSKFWLSSSSVVKDSSNRISQLNDLTGNNFVFTQSTNNNKPILSNNDIVFDGVDDVLNGTTASKSMLNAAQVVWQLAVVKRTALDGGNVDRTLFNMVRGTSNAVRFNTQLNSSELTVPNAINLGTRRLDADSFDNLSAGIASNLNYQIIIFKADYINGVKEIYLNGSLASSKPTSVGTISNVNALAEPTIGAFLTSTGYERYSNMAVKDIITGVAQVDTTNRQKLEGWAAHKYGLKANLPPDHPYKVLVPTI